jgi:diketogulonate reductase-like aldo/keto reductase
LKTFDMGADAAARSRLAALLDAFVELGGSLVDSSPMDGSGESVVGDLAVAGDLRHRLFVATKVWTTGRSDGERQMRESMQKLECDRLDLMQVHNLQDAATHLDTMRARKAGGGFPTSA